MIKKLFYHWVFWYNYKDKTYEVVFHKKYLYGEQIEEGIINYYATYHKATKDYPEDFYDYEMCSEDVDQIKCFHIDNYDIWSEKKLTKTELIEKFEAYMARKINRVVLDLQENYSNIKKALEDNDGKEN